MPRVVIIGNSGWESIDRFVEAHEHWVIEGCYADLAAHALPHCTKLGSACGQRVRGRS